MQTCRITASTFTDCRGESSFDQLPLLLSQALERRRQAYLRSLQTFGMCILQIFNLNNSFICRPQALERRMQAYRRQGRHVILVGDLNITPAPMDRADPDVDHLARPDLRWLAQLLAPAPAGGGFCDAFRRFHPHRCVAGHAPHHKC